MQLTYKHDYYVLNSENSIQKYIKNKYGQLKQNLKFTS